MSQEIKKILLYLVGGGAILLGIIFMISFAVLNTSKVSIGKEYSYKATGIVEDSDSSISSATCFFEDNQYVRVEYTLGSGYSNTFTATYRISNDKTLYLSTGTSLRKVGTCNACEADVNTVIYGVNVNIKLVCHSANAAKIVCLIFMLLGFAGGITCIVTQILLNKKNYSLTEFAENEQTQAQNK